MDLYCFAFSIQNVGMLLTYLEILSKKLNKCLILYRIDILSIGHMWVVYNENGSIFEWEENPEFSFVLEQNRNKSLSLSFRNVTFYFHIDNGLEDAYHKVGNDKYGEQTIFHNSKSNMDKGKIITK